MSRRGGRLRHRMFVMHAESTAYARQAARWRVSTDVDQTLREVGEVIAAELATLDGHAISIGSAAAAVGGDLFILGLAVIADPSLPPNSIVLEEGAPIGPNDGRMAVR